MSILLLAVIAVCVWELRHGEYVFWLTLVTIVAAFCLRGLFTVSPNQGKVR